MKEAEGHFSLRVAEFDEAAEKSDMRRHVLLLLILIGPGMTEAIEPISTSIAVGMAAALTGFLASYQNIFYYFHECCRPEWISFNRAGNTTDTLANTAGLSVR